MSRIVSALALAICLVVPPSRLRAQATAPVPLQDWSYDDLDLLIDHGLAPSAVVGQRPYSRRAMASFIAEARASGTTAPLAIAAVRRLAEEYALELQVLGGMKPAGWHRAGLVDEMRLEGAIVNSPARALPNPRRVDAETNPIVSYRGARPIGDGYNVAFETSHRVQLGSIALVARPRYAWNDPTDTGATRHRVELPVASLRAVARNVALEVGRFETVLGTSDDAALAISTNAPPLEGIKLESDLPFRLPWIGRRLGPSRTMILLASLGESATPAGARLLAYKASWRPAASVEFGLTSMNQWGGEGAPEATLGERLIDFLPLADVLFLQDRDIEVSNKLAGVDVRVTIPKLNGMQTYAELLLDDFDVRRFGSIFLHDAGWLLGIRLPRFGADGALAARAEYQYTGIRLYEHSQFTSGLTYERSLIGNALGPRGSAVVLEGTVRGRSGTMASLRVASESRSSDQYAISWHPVTRDDYRLWRTVDLPTELRDRLSVGLKRPLPGGWGVAAIDLGVEAVRNSSFEGGNRRTNSMLTASLDLRR